MPAVLGSVARCANTASDADPFASKGMRKPDTTTPQIRGAPEAVRHTPAISVVYARVIRGFLAGLTHINLQLNLGA